MLEITSCAPLRQTVKLLPTEQHNLYSTTPTTNERVGWVCDISGDGSTLVLGTYGTTGGGVYIFSLVDGVFVFQQKILPGSGNQNFGKSVALSQDGSVLAIGATVWASGAGGYIAIYRKNGSSWAYEASLLPNTFDSSKGYVGEFLSISADGKTVVAGAPSTPSYYYNIGSAGRIFAFIYSGTSWSQLQAFSQPAVDQVTSNFFGKTVCLSADGLTLAVGAAQAAGAVGLIYTYTRATTSGFFDLQQKISAPVTDSIYYFGAVLALSKDGNTLATGAPSANSGAGTAYVYTRTNGAWTLAQKLTQGTPVYSSFGSAVSISDDGSLIAVGATSGIGAVYMYKRTGGTWTRYAVLQRENDTTNGVFGISIAMSSLGLPMVVGSPYQSFSSLYQPGMATVFQ